LAVFFILSSPGIFGGIGLAGPAGEFTFKIFSFLFGKGYYLLPILFLILSVSFFKSLKKKLALTHTVGGLLFFLASLSLVDILFSGSGGLVGGFISRPMLSLFALPASIIILLACIVISFLVMFDTPLRFSLLTNLFKKKNPDELGDDDLIIAKGSELQSLPENSQDKTAGEKNQPDEKSGLGKKIFGDGTPKDDFVMNNFSLNGKEFTPPPLSLLEKDRGRPGVGDIKANSNIIKRTLSNFGINVEMDEISIGPSITRYALKPAEGVKLSRIVGLQNDLSLALAAHPIRIEAPIPGKSLVGIEIPNSIKTTVGLGSLLGATDFQNSDKPLLICLGKGISGMSYFANLAKAPHLLIAGATGSGKSVTIHAIIASLLYRNSPDN
jgi:S-DNA-T family DNA segregation ATPase FtsK/SpoIIIE